MKFRIRYADQVVGVFVIVAFAALAVILLAVGSSQRWFARDYNYQTLFPSGAGLSVGTQIQLKGFQIGRITSIRLNGKNEAETSFVIYDNFVDRVRENSLLEFVTSPIGLGSQLLFHPGKSDKRLPERSFIPSFDTPEGRRLVAEGLVDRPPKDDTITRLMSNVNPLIENINATVVQLEKTISLVNGAIEGSGSGPVSDSMKQLSSTLAGVDSLVNQLNGVLSETGPRVNTVTAAVEQSVPRLLKDVEASVSSVNTITANLAKTSQAVADPTGLVPRLIDPSGAMFGHINSSLAQVEATVGNLNRATASFADQMPRIVATLDEVRGAIDQAQAVLEGLRNNPLLRGGISERVQSSSLPSAGRTTDF